MDADRVLAEKATDLERISCLGLWVEVEAKLRRIGRPIHLLQMKESDMPNDLLQSDSMVGATNDCGAKQLRRLNVVQP